MAKSPPAIQEIANNPDFQGLPKSEKLKVMRTLYADFSGLSGSEQLKVINQLETDYTPADLSEGISTEASPPTVPKPQPIPEQGVNPIEGLGRLGMGGLGFVKDLVVGTAADLARVPGNIAQDLPNYLQDSAAPYFEAAAPMRQGKLPDIGALFRPNPKSLSPLVSFGASINDTVLDFGDFLYNLPGQTANTYAGREKVPLTHPLTPALMREDPMVQPYIERYPFSYQAGSYIDTLPIAEAVTALRGQRPAKAKTPLEPSDNLRERIVPFERPRVETSVSARIVPEGDDFQQRFSPADLAEMEALYTQNDILTEKFKARELIEPEQIAREKQAAFKNIWREGNLPTQFNRQAHIVVGLPGAGKSSAIANKLKADLGAIVLDSDMAKEAFTEFQGGVGAGAVHKASKGVLERAIAAAKEQGANIVMPVVGKDEANLRKQIQDYKDSGYEVYLHHVQIDPNEAVNRAWNRYKEEGRFVDPQYVKGVGLKAKETFDKLIKEDLIDGFQEFDNNVPKNTPAKLVRSGGRLETQTTHSERLGYVERSESRGRDGRPQSRMGDGTQRVRQEITGPIDPSSQKRIVDIKQTLDAYQKAGADVVSRKKAAMQFQEMAQSMTRAEFEAAMKEIPQKKLDDIGRELGC